MRRGLLWKFWFMVFGAGVGAGFLTTAGVLTFRTVVVLDGLLLKLEFIVLLDDVVEGVFALAAFEALTSSLNTELVFLEVVLVDGAGVLLLLGIKPSNETNMISTSYNFVF